MACNQNTKKKDLKLVTDLARKFSNLIQENVRIYRKYCDTIGVYYDFEPEYVINENSDVVEVIKYIVLL